MALPKAKSRSHTTYNVFDRYRRIPILCSRAVGTMGNSHGNGVSFIPREASSSTKATEDESLPCL